jgi:peptide/nickel transport system substrate-binding protein
VCSGPYQFKERVQNDRIVLDKFAKYWDAADYHFDRVIFMPMPDSTIRLNNLRSGQLNIAERIAPSDVPAVKSDPKLALMPVTGLGFQAISINMGNGKRADNPLAKDKRVRQALDLAIDRDAIDQVVGGGMFQPAHQPFPPASFAYDKNMEHAGSNARKARELLKEAGYPRVKFELSYGNNTTMEQTMEMIQAMGAEAGFDISLRPMEFAALQAALAKGDFEVGQTGWSGRVDPGGNIDSYIRCKGSLNDGKYCDAQVDQWLADAQLTADEGRRKALYAKVLEKMRDERPEIYLYYLPYPDGLIRLKGVTLSGK